MTTIPQATLDAYFSAWNERNDAARAKLVADAWAEQGTYEDAQVALTGRDAIAAHIGAALAANPQRRLEKGEPLEGSGGATGFTWTQTGDDRTHAGFASASVDAAGKLTAVKSWEAPKSDAAENGWLRRVRSWSLSTWLQVLGLVALVGYLMLRLPAEVFYEEFDASPEEVGFGDVAFVLRQYSRVIIYFLGLGLAWSAFYLAGMYPAMVIVSTRLREKRPGRMWEAAVAIAASLAGIALLRDGIDGGDPLRLAIGGALIVGPIVAANRIGARAERRESNRIVLRWAAGVVVFGSLAFGGFTYLVGAFVQAGDDADLIKSAAPPDRGLLPVPWQPRRVQVTWTTEKTPLDLPGCSELTYLGQGEKHVVLYDGLANRTVRISEGDVVLAFPDDCD